MVFFTDRDLSSHIFVNILRNAGLTVHRHDDHFEQDTHDDVWLPAVGQRGWIAISKNSDIYYQNNERDAMMRANARLFIVIGSKATHKELAEHFLACIHKIRRFLDKYPAPFIARVYLPTPEQRRRGSHKSGRVELWLSHADWLKKVERQ